MAPLETKWLPFVCVSLSLKDNGNLQRLNCYNLSVHSDEVCQNVLTHGIVWNDSMFTVSALASLFKQFYWTDSLSKIFSSVSSYIYLNMRAEMRFRLDISAN